MKLALVLSITAGIATLFAQEGKLAPDLWHVDADESVDVIIQMEEPPAAAGGRRGMPFLVPRALNTSQKPTRFASFPGFTARVKGSALAELARDSQVKYISPDREVSARTTAAIAATNVTVTQAAGLTAKGVGIAVIDSGIALQNDLLDKSCNVNQRRIRYSEDFVSRPAGQAAPTTPLFDTYGHGTHVAGIIAGDGNCGGSLAMQNGVQQRFLGVAPGAH